MAYKHNSSTTDELEGLAIKRLLCHDRLRAAEEVVKRWAYEGAASDPDGGHEAWDSPKFVAAVRELLFLSSDVKIYHHRAEIALKTAITYLVDEFRQVLILGTNFHPPDSLQGSLYDSTVLPARSFSFSSLVNLEAKSVCSFSTAPNDDSQTYCTGFSKDSVSMEQAYLHLIDPEAAIVLKEIAELIILAGHAPDLCNIYSETRHNSLKQCLYLLGVQVQSSPASAFEGGYNMQLDGCKVKHWIKGLKIIVGTVLPEERQACAQIFGCDKRVEQDCFNIATTRCTKQFLALGSAIAEAKGYHYERVPFLLLMHEELAKLQPSLQVLFFGDAKQVICQETSKLLDRLREASLPLLLEFSKLQFDYKPDDKAAIDGNILSLTVLVMHFLKLLAENCDSLNLILPLKEDVAAHEADTEKTILPWERYVLKLLSSLQLRIVEASESYKDERLRHIFLMNNAMYVLEYARTSVLSTSLKDDWIHQHPVFQVEKYATAYFRASWSRALCDLVPKVHKFSQPLAKKIFSQMWMKEKLKNFNLAFKEIIRVQTTWKVPNPQLRLQLRITILENVLQAYRQFLGRGGYNAGKNLKYTPHDIENYVMDLFEG